MQRTFVACAFSEQQSPVTETISFHVLMDFKFGVYRSVREATEFQWERGCETVLIGRAVLRNETAQCAVHIFGKTVELRLNC